MDATNSENNRAVRCFHCGRPIRVSTFVAQKESKSKFSSSTERLFGSRVFALRCRLCEKESIYTMNQVEDSSLIQLSA